MTGKMLPPSFCLPLEVTDAGVILSVCRSLTTTSSVEPLVSLLVRFVAQVVNATYRPSAEMVGSTLSRCRARPLRELTRTVTSLLKSRR